MMCDTLYRNCSAICGVLVEVLIECIPTINIALKLEISEYNWALMEEMLIVLKSLQTATRILCSE